MAKGGGLSIVGDLLLNEPGTSVSGFAKSLTGMLAGPAVSDAARAITISIAAG